MSKVWHVGFEDAYATGDYLGVYLDENEQAEYDKGFYSGLRAWCNEQYGWDR